MVKWSLFFLMYNCGEMGFGHHCRSASRNKGGAEHPSRKEVVVSTFKAGYGHIRGALALLEPLADLGVDAEMVDLGVEGGRLMRGYLKALRGGLDFFYRHAPGLFLRVSRKGGRGGMGAVSRVGALASGDTFDRRIAPDAKVVVAAHSLAADVTKKPAFLLCLDPFPPLYQTENPNAVTLTPDLPTAEGLKEISRGAFVVTGPIVARPIVEARGRAAERREELRSGAGLRITIATGGSLTHGGEIVALTEAYADALVRGERIERVSVVVGSSTKMRDMVREIIDSEPGLRGKMELIYDEDPVELVRKADRAMGESDVIHAKTGELVYTVAGGKAFETFHKHPSLAEQEVRLREYVRKKTAVEGVSSLEIGKADARAEVKKVLGQLESGVLLRRMELGLRVPANGAEYAARLVANRLKQLTEEQQTS